MVAISAASPPTMSTVGLVNSLIASSMTARSAPNSVNLRDYSIRGSPVSRCLVLTFVAGGRSGRGSSLLKQRPYRKL